MAEEQISVKISELTETTSFNDDDELPLVQDGTTKKIKRTKVVESIKADLGSAAQASTTDFEPAGSVAGVETQFVQVSNQQNERIERLEYSIYLIQKNGVFKAYRTKALMLTDVASIPVNSIVSVVNDPANNAETNNINGEYHYNGTDFFKLPNNLLDQLNIKTAAAEENAKSYADVKKAEAIHTAAIDAQLKADDAETAAIASAAIDASTKAGAAETNAKEYTDIKIAFKQLANYEIVAVSADGVQLFATKSGELDFNVSDNLKDEIIDDAFANIPIQHTSLASISDFEIVAVSADGVQLFATKSGELDFNVSGEMREDILNELPLENSSLSTLNKHELVVISDDGVQLFETKGGIADFNLSNCIKEQVLKNTQSTRNIVMYGSSLTAMVGGTTSTLNGFTLPSTIPMSSCAPWQAVQANLTDRIVVNRAAGGHNIFQNAIRQGGRNFYVTLENNTLLGSGATLITSYGDFTPLNGQGIFEYDVTILGVPCSLKPQTINGVIDYSKLRLDRKVVGADLSVPSGTQLKFELAETLRNYTYIIEPNANWTTVPTRAQNYDLINCVLDMIKYASGVNDISDIRFLIAGNTPASTEKTSTEVRNRKKVREALFKEFFGDRYMDCADYMVNNAIYDAVYLGYLSEVTSDDLADIELGVIPRRLMHDVVHYNALGAYMLGRYYSLFIKAKGW